MGGLSHPQTPTNHHPQNQSCSTQAWHMTMMEALGHSVAISSSMILAPADYQTCGQCRNNKTNQTQENHKSDAAGKLATTRRYTTQGAIANASRIFPKRTKHFIKERNFKVRQRKP